MEQPELFIFITGVIASFVGSIAAGSGIIAISALLFLGIPPHVALGTLNLGDIGAKIGNIIRFIQHKNMGVLKRDVVILSLITVPATILGSMLVVSIDGSMLERVIGVALIVIFILLFANKDLGVAPNRAVGRKRMISHVAYFFSQAWAGFFSPGSGFIDLFVRTKGYGYTILQGKAVTRIPLLLSSITMALVFGFSGYINYRFAAAMFLGMMLGGYLGMAFAIKKGDAWIKPLLGVIILATAIKMIFF